MNSNKTIIGPTELIDFPVQGIFSVPARIDTGAKTNSLWVSDIGVSSKGISFRLFEEGSKYYSGDLIELASYDETVVSSSIGAPQRRYKVELVICLSGRKIRAKFTLADRSRQVYPVLIGRNTLRGKFVVDVKGDTLLKEYEDSRTQELRNLLDA